LPASGWSSCWQWGVACLPGDCGCRSSWSCSPSASPAGRATNDVHPNDLLGGVYQPFVSVAVGLILFEAGLRLRLGELAGGDRRVVRALILIGGPVTAVGVTLAVKLIFGLG
jgi:NhaP-type Na+/H+ or K+/H+ antiporter